MGEDFAAAKGMNIREIVVLRSRGKDRVIGRLVVDGVSLRGRRSDASQLLDSFTQAALGVDGRAVPLEGFLDLAG